MSCERPDRDVPKLVCGHPLPCPYHTVIIDTDWGTVSLPLGNARRTRLVVHTEDAPKRLRDIAGAIAPDDDT